MREIWNGVTRAESDDTLVVENNHHFPAESIRREHFLDSGTHTTCGWKGPASYMTVQAGGEVNRDAAWCYPDPEPADYGGHVAEELAGLFSFWKGVKVEA